MCSERVNVPAFLLINCLTYCLTLYDNQSTDYVKCQNVLTSLLKGPGGDVSTNSDLRITYSRMC